MLRHRQVRVGLPTLRAEQATRVPFLSPIPKDYPTRGVSLANKILCGPPAAKMRFKEVSGHTCIQGIFIFRGPLLTRVKNPLSSGEVSLTQHQLLAVNGSIHAISSGELSLVEYKVLQINSTIHSHIAENITLTQHYVLSVNNSSHILTSGISAMGTTAFLFS
jgi:hypothetical protein